VHQQPRSLGPPEPREAAQPQAVRKLPLPGPPVVNGPSEGRPDGGLKLRVQVRVPVLGCLLLPGEWRRRRGKKETHHVFPFLMNTPGNFWPRLGPSATFLLVCT
jgi:hypothetical protein